MVRFSSFLVILFSLIAMSAVLSAESLVTELDPPVVFVGDETVLNIQLPDAVSPESLSIEPADDQAGKVLVGEFSHDIETNRLLVPVRPLTSEVTSLLPFTVTVRSEGTEDLLFQTQELPVIVNPPDLPEEAAREYTPYMAAPFNWARATLITGATGVSLATLAFLLLLLIRRLRSKDTTEAPASPPINPVTELAAALDDLKTLGRFRAQGTEAHCTLLSFVLRRYLERTCQMPAIELSDDEVVDRIEREELNNPSLTTLSRVFHDMSLAKFARANMTEDQIRRQVDLAVVFVNAERERMATQQQRKEAS